MADIASQGNLFVNIVGQAALKKLERVRSADIKDGRSTEVVMAIGVKRGAGFRRKQGGLEIDLDVYEEEGRQPEVDWHAVNESEATFTFVTQLDGDSFRYAYTVQVSKVDRTQDAEGAMMQKVNLACTQVNRT